MIKAELVADSINPVGNRLTTWVLTYPRFIHSEFMTHRVFSRNAASSRAIPTAKMIEAVETNPAMPVSWGKNQKGMQAGAELTPDTRVMAKAAWIAGRDAAVLHAKRLLDLGVHKQLVNRVIEPWMHMTVIATATEHANFFKLRAHPDAQPEFQALAYLMQESYARSTPKLLQPGGWHLPFISKEEYEGHALEIVRAMSVARCARVSYTKHDEIKTVTEDLLRHDDLARSGHWSPFEHQAMALGSPERVGNFVGWLQYRKLMPNENGVSNG